MSAASEHRAGFVVLGGRSNVGKSTLVNRMVGHKVAIVTPKPQTTRRKVLGIRSDADAQIIFIDTPGIHESPKLLNRRMVQTARQSLADAEVVMGVIEAADRISAEDQVFIEELRGLQRPKLLVVNKIDLIQRARMLPMLEECTRELPGVEIIPVSAKTGENLEELLRVLKSMLPASPALMSEEEYTDQTERALAEEIIREKLFLKLEREIPFSTAVIVEAFSEDAEKKLIRISATIIVERDSHKGIVIGAGGRMIKDIGTAARLELEEIFGWKVFLELTVKVERDWTRNPRKLQELGL
ncbi:MAG TPA: GTPase Era [Candidatus Binataceae bacterium]|nr:GTPase Era [Candidatus Binataceae bacterium]